MIHWNRQHHKDKLTEMKYPQSINNTISENSTSGLNEEFSYGYQLKQMPEE